MLEDRCVIKKRFKNHWYSLPSIVHIQWWNSIQLTISVLIYSVFKVSGFQPFISCSTIVFEQNRYCALVHSAHPVVGIKQVNKRFSGILQILRLWTPSKSEIFLVNFKWRAKNKAFILFLSKSHVITIIVLSKSGEGNKRSRRLVVETKN